MYGGPQSTILELAHDVRFKQSDVSAKCTYMYSPSYIFLELTQEWFADWHYTISNLKHTLGWVAMRINQAH